MPASELADLAYIAIKNSNDYKSENPTEEVLYKLNNLLANKINDEARIKKAEIEKEDLTTHLLFGLSQKQFWYQEIILNRNLYYNFLRYYILLNEIPRFFPEIRLPDDDLIEITGFNIKRFSQLLMALWSFNYSNSLLQNITVEKDLTEKIPIITEKNLKRCLEFFTADYNYYRKKGFPNNPLFFKPIIKTDTGKLIISNAFIWARKFYEGIYWLIRDKYLKENSHNFTNNFGRYYERYVQEIFEHYLKAPQYKKIKTIEGEKRADWLIYTRKYILILEQKSCLMSIALKKEYPSLQSLDKYLENFMEAYFQLADTVKALGKTEKKIIKLVLTFEKLYMRETIIKDRVNKLCNNKIDDLSNYFFIDTEELEKLIQCLAEDEENFNRIIEDKITLPEEFEFNTIINKYIKSNKIEYLESHKHLFDGLFENLESV